MSERDGKALVGLSDETFHVRWTGEIRYPMAPRLDAFYGEVLRSCTFSTMCIDLREATVLDSTALGLLARMGTHMLSQVGRRAVIVYAPGDVFETLQVVGFDDVFVMVTEPPGPQPKFTEIAAVADVRPLGVTMLEAHEELMALNERNLEEFRAAVGILRRGVRAAGGGDSEAR